MQVVYAIDAKGAIGFRVTGRDPSATLVIDPSISVAYTSFLGGSGSDDATSVAVDSVGNVYLGGTTTSAATFAEGNSQVGPGIASSSGSGSANPPEEFFIAKLDPTQSGANSLVYLTFLGGSTNQAGGLIAVDASGNVAITGTTTSTDFPVTDGSTLKSGPNSTIVSEVDPTGSKLVYSTLFGGSGAQSTQAFGGISVDKTGNIFVASDTNSSNLPATSAAYATAYQSTSTDGFLAIFQPSATPHLKYCSYLGLNAHVGIGGIAVDTSGNAYVAGFISNPLSAFPSTNALQSAYAGGDFDAFLMKISPGGKGAADLIYATLLGGSGSDQAFAVAVDSSTPPNAYVTGTTSSTNFPTKGAIAAYQASLPYNATTRTSDAFVSVIAQSASTGQTSLAYSTYLGGTQVDAGYDLAVVEPWAIYITGAAKSWDFPWRDNFQPFNGYGNAFVAKLDPTSAGAASLVYSTPLGGTSPPGVNVGSQGSAIGVDASSDIWVAGQTTSADFPSAGNPGNGFQPVCASCQQAPPQSDAFVVEIRESSAQLPSLYFAAPGIPLNFGKQPLGSINIPPQFAAIKNGGEAALEISAIGIIGPNSGDFSLSNAGGCAPARISPGDMCSFEVGFIPSVAGAEGAFVAVTSNAPGNPQVLQLVGTGLGLAAEPASLNFAKQIAGTVSAAQSVTLTNNTGELLYLDSLGVGGANGTSFAPSTNCVIGPSGMMAGATCTISITFQPSSSGSFVAEIDVQYHIQEPSEQELVVPLSGAATAPAPAASIQPITMNFGSISVGTKTSAQVATLTNTGSTPLTLSGIGLTGANAADFAIVSSSDSACPVSGGNLAINASCTVGVQFAPQTSGTKSAALSFADNAAGSPQTVALSGAAQSPATIQITPQSLTFSSQSVGTKSATQQITITDTSTSLLAINGITLTGTNADDFSQTNNCPASLAASASCVINVVFQPAASGTRSASMSISDDAANSPQVVALTGAGTQSVVVLSPGSVTFGNQIVGTPSAAVAITVSNSGNGDLVFNEISIPNSDFSETHDCPTAPNGISPGGSCTIKVIFTPVCSNSTSARTASLSISDNAAGSPQSVALSGTATGSFCFVVPAGSSTSATVSPGQTASYALQVSAASGFTGSIGFTCAGAPSASTCTVSPTTATVGGGTVVNVAVSVATTAPSLTTGWRVPKVKDVRGAAKVLGFLALAMVSALIAIVVGRAEPGHRGTVASRAYDSRIWRFVQISACVCLVALFLAACGGGGNGSTQPPPQDPGTPRGTFTITLSGTPSGGSSQSIALTLNVQ